MCNVCDNVGWFYTLYAAVKLKVFVNSEIYIYKRNLPKGCVSLLTKCLDQCLIPMKACKGHGGSWFVVRGLQFVAHSLF